MNLNLTGLQNLPCADSVNEQKINQNFWQSLSNFSIKSLASLYQRLAVQPFTNVTFLNSLAYTNVITACERKSNSTVTMAHMVKC
jgi:hypothetical protein